MKRLIALAFAGAFLLGCSDQAKPEAFLAGDSHCVGLAQTAKLKSVARGGASTREVVSQIKRIPEGAVVIVCAGTNDMPAGVNGFYAAVDAVLLEAERRKQKLIWVGPINTPLWWDKYSAQADEYLKSKLPHYVSMRQRWVMRGPDREHDGVFHLTPEGRKKLWNLVKEKLQ